MSRFNIDCRCCPGPPGSLQTSGAPFYFSSFAPQKRYESSQGLFQRGKIDLKILWQYPV